MNIDDYASIPLSYNTTKIYRLLSGLCVQCGKRAPKKGKRWCWMCIRKTNGKIHKRIRSKKR